MSSLGLLTLNGFPGKNRSFFHYMQWFVGQYWCEKVIEIAQAPYHILVKIAKSRKFFCE